MCQGVRLGRRPFLTGRGMMVTMSLYIDVDVRRALRDVCQVLKAHDPLRDWDKDTDFRRGLAEKLMDLADAGVTEPQEFRSRVLASCDLKPFH